MAELDTPFDFTTIDVTDNFDPLPPGEYVLEVIDSELRQTKAGDGDYFALRFRVCDGRYENRNIFININRINKNPASQSIGQKALAQLCTAIKLPGPLRDTTELHNIPMIGRIAIEEGKNGYPDRNKIVAYKSIDSAPVAVVAAAAPAAVAKSAAPWKR